MLMKLTSKANLKKVKLFRGHRKGGKSLHYTRGKSFTNIKRCERGSNVGYLGRGGVLKTASETLMHTKMMSCNDFEWGGRN
jgi:hypothetical protein